jgi:hypothetical protein
MRKQIKLFTEFLIKNIPSTAINRAGSMNLICNYGFRDHNSAYTCDVDAKTTFRYPYMRIDAITGRHHSGMETNEVVTIVVASLRNLKYFPQGLDKFFENLKNIKITHANLTFIFQSDLRPFSKLQFLNLNHNQLRIIEKELFRFNAELEWVWLSYNQISHIDPSAFAHLKLLHSLSLSLNNCTAHFHIASTRVEVKNYTARIAAGECLNLQTNMEIYEHTLMKLDEIKSTDSLLCQQSLDNDKQISHQLDKVAGTVMCLALLTLASLIASAGACVWIFIVMRRKKKPSTTTRVDECNRDAPSELRDIDSFSASFEEDVYEKVR